MRTITLLPVTDSTKHSVGVGAYVRRFPDSPVPCGTCSACCRSEFDLNLSRHDDPSQYITEVGPKTGLVSLKKTADGACIYLQDDRCSIYDRRPVTCRVFDCRPEVLCGLQTDDLYNQAAWEKFDFSYRAPDDVMLRRCLHLLMRLLVPLARHEGKGDHAAVVSAIVVLQTCLKRNGNDVTLAYAAALIEVAQDYKRHGLPLPPFPDELK